MNIREEQVRIVVQAIKSAFIRDLVEQEFSTLGDDAQRLWDKYVAEDLCVNLDG